VPHGLEELTALLSSSLEPPEPQAAAPRVRAIKVAALAANLEERRVDRCM
jgi:hypothetical protein